MRQIKTPENWNDAQSLKVKLHTTHETNIIFGMSTNIRNRCIARYQAIQSQSALKLLATLSINSCCEKPK